MDVSQISNSDFFFYYGFDLEQQTEADLMQLLLNPLNDMMYNRYYGAGVVELENTPNSLAFQILSRYRIANAITKRNSVVSDGRNNLVDRRVAVSQNFIQFTQKGDNTDIMILYFLYAKHMEYKTLTTPI